MASLLIVKIPIVVFLFLLWLQHVLPFADRGAQIAAHEFISLLGKIINIIQDLAGWLP